MFIFVMYDKYFCIEWVNKSENVIDESATFVSCELIMKHHFWKSEKTNKENGLFSCFITV